MTNDATLTLNQAAVLATLSPAAAAYVLRHGCPELSDLDRRSVRRVLSAGRVTQPVTAANAA